jgi:nicotinate-nucleotide adenylyltransferase
MKATGLLFGSFNPVHNGHLIIASFMRQHAALSDVWWVVSPHNPLKERKTLAHEKDRLHMVKLAIKGNPDFIASDVEFKLDKPSYTINTLEHLSRAFPKRKFCLIMGSDNLESIYHWKEWSKIVNQYMILVYRRGPVNDIEWKQFPGVLFFNAPLMHISSSMIREWIYNKKSVQYLVPDQVLKYIQAKKLYRVKKK